MRGERGGVEGEGGVRGIQCTVRQHKDICHTLMQIRGRRKGGEGRGRGGGGEGEGGRGGGGYALHVPMMSLSPLGEGGGEFRGRGIVCLITWAYLEGCGASWPHKTTGKNRKSIIILKH